MIAERAKGGDTETPSLMKGWACPVYWLSVARLWHKDCVNNGSFDFARTLRKVIGSAGAERISGIEANGLVND